MSFPVPFADSGHQGLDAVSLRPIALSVLEINIVHDLSERDEAVVFPEGGPVDEHLERAAVALVGELGFEHVEAQLAFPFGATFGRHEFELRFRVDEAADEPGRRRDGVQGQPVLQFSIPRAEPVKDHAMEVSEAMGSAIAISFQSATGRPRSPATFVLTADEVNPVMKALRSNGVEVTAIHNHMLDDEPRLFFMLFWGNDDPQKLAALDRVKITKTGAQ